MRYEWRDEREEKRVTGIWEMMREIRRSVEWKSGSRC